MLLPRPRGLAGTPGMAQNPRAGKYAAEARAFMRERGLSCYKMMTPGSTRAKEVMERLHSTYTEAGFAADPKILRLLDPWTQDLALKGPSTGQKFVCKDTEWIQRAMGTTDPAAVEAYITLGDGKSVAVDLVKLHLAGTLGVKTMCIKGPEEMTGRNEERAARATELLYKYLAGGQEDSSRSQEGAEENCKDQPSL